MGRSTALKLAASGVNVVLNYGTVTRGADANARAEKVLEKIRSLGGDGIVVEANPGDSDQMADMIAKGEQRFGGIDILVNNAGGPWNVQPVAEITPEHWKDTLKVEIDAMFWAVRGVLPGMKERRWGRIVSIGMADALHCGGVEQYAADYTLGKAARTWMTEQLGVNLHHEGVTMNIIEPGLNKHMDLSDAVAAVNSEWDGWPDRKMPCSHDAAEIIGFLCSEAGRFVHRSVIRLPNHFPEHWDG